MAEKNIFVYKLSLLLNISDFSLFFMYKTATLPEKGHPSFAVSPSKNWEPLKSPPFFFENLVGGLTPPEKAGSQKQEFTFYFWKTIYLSTEPFKIGDAPGIVQSIEDAFEGIENKSLTDKLVKINFNRVSHNLGKHKHIAKLLKEKATLLHVIRPNWSTVLNIRLSLLWRMHLK